MEQKDMIPNKTYRNVKVEGCKFNWVRLSQKNIKDDKVLAVGERMNNYRDWKPCRPELNYSFDLRLRLGFYNRGPRRKFLNSLGIVWDDGVNLLWPSKTVGSWDADEARIVVCKILHDVVQYDKVLLFGRRVCDAFGVEFKVLKIVGRFVPLPHPSGLNRIWNDRELVKKIRKYFNELSNREEKKTSDRVVGKDKNKS